MDFKIQGHVAVVTGGGQGLGATICRALAAEGCRVAIWDINAEAAHSVAGDIEAVGGTCDVFVGDVTDLAEVNRVAEKLVEKLGAARILVNCAGFSRNASITEMTEEDWDDVIAVCLTAPFYVTRALVPQMIEQQYGRIINISSRARLGDPYKCNYAAAKAGLVGFSDALALELGQHGITVNSVAPGFIETDRARTIQYFDQVKSLALQRTSTARLGTPADIADAVCYLAAEQSGFITGEVLTIAGGRLR